MRKTMWRIELNATHDSTTRRKESHEDSGTPPQRDLVGNPGTANLLCGADPRVNVILRFSSLRVLSWPHSTFCRPLRPLEFIGGLPLSVSALLHLHDFGYQVWMRHRLDFWTQVGCAGLYGLHFMEMPVAAHLDSCELPLRDEC